MLDQSPITCPWNSRLHQLLLLGPACAALMLPMAFRPALAQRSGGSAAFTGTWKATDAVDDYEKAAVIVIKRVGSRLELIDRGVRPNLVLQAKPTGRTVTFVQKPGKRYAFTLQNGGRSLNEDVFSEGSHIGIHYVRSSRRSR